MPIVQTGKSCSERLDDLSVITWSVSGPEGCGQQARSLKPCTAQAPMPHSGDRKHTHTSPFHVDTICSYLQFMPHVAPMHLSHRCEFLWHLCNRHLSAQPGVQLGAGGTTVGKADLIPAFRALMDQRTQL